MIEATGFNITGRYLDELLPTEPEAPWMDLYRASYERRLPILGTSTCRTTNGGLFTQEYGLFPLRRGGASVDQFLAIEDYGDLHSTLMDLVDWRERGAVEETMSYRLGNHSSSEPPTENPCPTSNRSSSPGAGQWSGRRAPVTECYAFQITV